MALSTGARTAITAVVAVVLLGAAAVGYLIFTGNTEGIPFLGGTRQEAICPLTQEVAESESLVDRPALAVKVENVSSARPQAGLLQADTVYEEPVEGGITRFVVLYHCENAGRIGPIRSARFVDPNILVQYGKPIFGYSGGIPQVIEDIRATDAVQDVGFDREPDAFVEDPNRSAPHNIYSSSRLLYQHGRRAAPPPEPVFEYGEEPPPRQGSRRARELHLPFSPDADVVWRYQPGQGTWARFHGETPHTVEDGTQVTASNIVVQQVELVDTGIVDPAGNPSPEVRVVGSGQAWVFRDGRVVEGTWTRDTVSDRTVFTDRRGNEIPLTPGTTWVELFPSDLTVAFS